MEHIKNEEKVVITGAENTKLVVKTNNNTYDITMHVIKGLYCKILLGIDFNIKIT
jgi:hypothetical protein